MIPVVRRRLLALSALLWLPGCGKLASFFDVDGDDTGPGRPAEPLGGASEPVDPNSALPEALERSPRKLRFPAKSGEHMGFDLDRLSKLRALAGAVEVPEWSSAGEGVERHVRDDDLRTAWSCRVQPERPCAIGIHFPEPAEVEVVRLYTIPSADKTPRARPKRVRLHTAEGWAEARLPDEEGLWHVLLGESVRTRNLSLEVLEVHGSGPMELAELEVYGRSGIPREALTVDLSRIAVSFDGPVWRKKLRTSATGLSFIETVEPDGHLRRLVPGSALVGRLGDRMLLIERASWTTCSDHQGAYDLLDTRTRVLVPLGDMGGFPGDVFRHTAGLGFAIGRVSGYEARVQGVVIDEGVYERRTTGRLEQRAPTELLGDWGVEVTPLRHVDAAPLADASLGCELAPSAALTALRAHLPKRTKLAATQWYACDLGAGGRLLMTTGGPCGKQWHVVVLDAEEELVGQRSGKEPGTHARLRRIDASTMLVELWGSADRPRLLQAESGGLVEVGETTAFSLRPPASCRKRCDMELRDLEPGS